MPCIVNRINSKPNIKISPPFSPSPIPLPHCFTATLHRCLASAPSLSQTLLYHCPNVPLPLFLIVLLSLFFTALLQCSKPQYPSTSRFLIIWLFHCPASLSDCSIVPLPHYLTVPLSRFHIIWLFHCPASTLSDCSIVPLPHYLTVPLSRFHIIWLFHCPAST